MAEDSALMTRQVETPHGFESRTLPQKPLQGVLFRASLEGLLRFWLLLIKYIINSKVEISLNMELG